MDRETQQKLYSRHRDGCLIKVRGTTIKTIKRAASGYCSAIIPANNMKGKKNIPLDTVEEFDVQVYAAIPDWHQDTQENA